MNLLPQPSPRPECAPWRMLDSRPRRLLSFGARLSGGLYGVPAARSADSFVAGLFVPTGGAVGIWGPSAISCAQLAVKEINQSGGIQGKELRIAVVNAVDEAADLYETTRQLIASCDIHAIVGMHTSSVRKVISRAAGGQVPFVYTPMYEGGEQSPGVYAIGEIPDQQLLPAIEYFFRNRHIRRWAFVGNDYVWPRQSHAYAREYIEKAGGEVLADWYLPFGTSRFDTILEKINHLRPQALLLSLVGQDAIAFNRSFGTCGGKDILRFSAAIGENELLAIGAANTRNLFVASGYFAGLNTDDNLAFKERYYRCFGTRAPALNSLGQSTYEGLKFLASLGDLRDAQLRSGNKDVQLISYASVRGVKYASNCRLLHPTYLAQAQGHLFGEFVRL